MYIGIYTFNQRRESIIHKIFLSLCTSYAIWSFAYAFAYVASDRYVFSFWNKISAIGWCSFSAISLYLVLLITENKIIRKRIVKVLIFFPAVIFYCMAVFLFGVDRYTSPIIFKLFNIGDFLYDFIFEITSIIILFFWGLKSHSRRIKKQANILVLSSIVPFIANLVTQNILPIIGGTTVPLMGQIYSLIMIIGTYIVITKYKFLKLPEKFLFEEIENKIMDMFIFINEKGEFVKISKHTLTLLGYEEKELLNKNLDVIFGQNSKLKGLEGLAEELDKEYTDVIILKKNGEKIPVNISCISIFDNKLHEFLGAALVMHDVSIVHELQRKNQELQEKSIRDSLTKLYNHQYSIEIIQREVNQSTTIKRDLSIMMLDIDHFKKVNDSFGHQFGDYVLETVSNILVNNINNKGYVGRFGGEEFIVILPQLGIDEAYNIGEKIRNEIEKYKFNRNFKLTTSIGIKQHKGESTAELVKLADDLLYKAKKNGRNRIEYSD
jgi:diguanylate cyclase (GGDEF)-like protein/PAS domain S-box-containing protein